MKTTFFFLMLVLSMASVAHEGNDFKVTLDVLGFDGDQIQVSEETAVVPFVTGEEGQQFRLSITPRHDKNYSYYSISHLPGKPKVLEGYDESEQSKEVGAGYVSQVRTIRGQAISYFVLHEGDPLGEYRIEVYINDQRSKTFTFNLVEKNGAAGSGGRI